MTEPYHFYIIRKHHNINKVQIKKYNEIRCIAFLGWNKDHSMKLLFISTYIVSDGSDFSPLYLNYFENGT